MIVDAVVGYDMTYIKRGSRKVRTDSVLEIVPVMVREVGPTAPVIEVEMPHTAGQSWHMLDDALYHVHRDQAEYDKVSLSHELVQPYLHNPAWIPPTFPETRITADKALDVFSVREVISTTRDEAIARVSALAGSFLMSEGTLLVPSKGAIMYLSTAEVGGEKETWLPEVGNIHPLRMPFTSLSFGIADAEEMYEHAEAAGFDIRESDRPVIAMSDGVVGKLLSFRDKVLVSAARDFFLEGTGSRTSSNYSMDHMSAYIAYTEEGFDRDTVSDELVALLRQGAGGAIEGRRRNSSMQVVELAAAKAMFALAGWDARPDLTAGGPENDTSPSP